MEELLLPHISGSGNRSIFSPTYTSIRDTRAAKSTGNIFKSFKESFATQLSDTPGEG